MKNPIRNRGIVVFAAILIQFCLGAIYAWPVFTEPLKEAGWSGTQTQAAFSAGLATFAIVTVIAGRMMARRGPRPIAIAGGLVLGLGYLLAGLLGPTRFWTVLLCIGVVSGAGIGLAYVVPIAVGIRWFPDKKGLISGLAVAGFGFGATLWVKLADSWGRLLETIGLGQTFILYGILFMVMTGIGCIWMVFPPEGYTPAGWSSKTEDKKASPTAEFESREMLKTVPFYLIFLTFTIGAAAGLMSIGLMKLFPKPELMKSGLDGIRASAIAGTAMAVFFALANGLGRILWGAVSDRIGRKRSLVIMMATQGVFVFLFQYMAGIPFLLYLGATLIGFNYGGAFALFPTITADTFGPRHIGQNYGWVFLAYGVGGIFGPLLGGRLGDMGNFPLAFAICGVLCLVGALLILFVRQPRRIS